MKLTPEISWRAELYWNGKRRFVTCGWDDSEQNLPEEGEEVHDVVAARRHLLLGLLAFFAFLLVVVT